MSKSDFILSHHLWFDLNVSLLGWEIKTDMRSQLKHGPWRSNMRTGKYFPNANWNQFLCTFYASIRIK